MSCRAEHQHGQYSKHEYRDQRPKEDQNRTPYPRCKVIHRPRLRSFVEKTSQRANSGKNRSFPLYHAAQPKCPAIQPIATACHSRMPLAGIQPIATACHSRMPLAGIQPIAPACHSRMPLAGIQPIAPACHSRMPLPGIQPIATACHSRMPLAGIQPIATACHSRTPLAGIQRESTLDSGSSPE